MVADHLPSGKCDLAEIEDGAGGWATGKWDDVYAIGGQGQ